MEQEVTSEKLLKAALLYAYRGWYVFPLSPKTKIPLKGSAGFKDATRDPDVIRAWWTDSPLANIGLDCERSGVVVLDVDVKNGKVGAESLMELTEGEASHLATLHARTWSGGDHYFFRGSQASSASKLARDLDIKGDGGYVVLAPSCVEEDGKAGVYTWTDTEDFREEGALTESLLGFPDLFRPIEKVKTSITEVETFEEGTRNKSLFDLGCSYRGRGMGRSEIAMLLDDANKKRCKIPVDPKELAKIIDNVMQKSVNEPILEGPVPEPTFETQTRFSNYTPPAKGPVPKPKFCTLGKLKETPQSVTKWMVDELLPVGGIMLMAGDSGAGKTELAANLALAVVNGGEFLSRKCEQGVVAWINLDEPVATFCDRMGALEMPDDQLVYCGADSFDELAAGQEMAWLESLIEEAQPRIVFIDTLGRFLKIKDFNDYGPFQRATDRLRPIIEKYGSTIVFLHHLKKGTTELNGSGGIKGCLDVLQLVVKAPNGKRTTYTDKVRGLARDIEPTDLQFDEETRRITAAAPEWMLQRDRAASNMLEYLQRIGKATADNLVEHSKGKAPVARDALKRMAANGTILTTGSGKKGDPCFYSLPGPQSAGLSFNCGTDPRVTENVPENVATPYSSSDKMLRVKREHLEYPGESCFPEHNQGIKNGVSRSVDFTPGVNPDQPGPTRRIPENPGEIMLPGASDIFGNISPKNTVVNLMAYAVNKLGVA